MMKVFSALEAQAATSNPKRKRDSNPQAISISTSQNFDGDDGPWSTFLVQAGSGSSGSDLRLLPSTKAWQTWVIIPDGCPSSIPGNCENDRGQLYDSGSSSSWSALGSGPSNLSIEDNLMSNSEQGLFGTDTVKWGSSGDGGPSLEKQVVVEINTLDFWLGLMGLNPNPTELDGSSQPSFMQTLKDQGTIPSVSYGYTAGNNYRNRGTFGSLTLGGVDQARFEPNDIQMGMADDPFRDLVVNLEAVKVTANGTDTQMLSQSIETLVDSTVSEIWLPEDACKAFEDAFQISWNSTQEIYTVTDDQQSKLQDSNPSVTFTLSSANGGKGSIDLVLPYSAFNLQASWPRFKPYPTVANYFPLRRAANASQYTLGRAFLQEVYLMVNYDNKTFSLSQALFPDSSTTNIQPIGLAGSGSGSSGGSGGGGMSKGAKIGIGVGVAVGGALLIAAFILFCLRRRRRTTEVDEINRDRKRGAFEKDGEAINIAERANPHPQLFRGHSQKESAHNRDSAQAPVPGRSNSVANALIPSSPRESGWRGFFGRKRGHQRNSSGGKAELPGSPGSPGAAGQQQQQAGVAAANAASPATSHGTGYFSPAMSPSELVGDDQRRLEHPRGVELEAGAVGNELPAVEAGRANNV